MSYFTKSWHFNCVRFLSQSSHDPQMKFPIEISPFAKTMRRKRIGDNVRLKPDLRPAGFQICARRTEERETGRQAVCLVEYIRGSESDLHKLGKLPVTRLFRFHSLSVELAYSHVTVWGGWEIESERERERERGADPITTTKPASR